MARKKLTPTERKRRKAERNRQYWESHKEEIAEKRKKKRTEAKDQKAREKRYQEQINAFIGDINADNDIQDVMRSILGGNDPKSALEEYARRKGKEGNEQK